jgi:hypothetical protein
MLLFIWDGKKSNRGGDQCLDRNVICEEVKDYDYL